MKKNMFGFTFTAAIIIMFVLSPFLALGTNGTNVDIKKEEKAVKQVVEVTVDFVKDSHGKVNELIILYNGKKTTARRVKARVAVFTGQRKELKISAVVDGPFPAKADALKKYGGKLPEGVIILNASPKGYSKGCFVVKQAAVISTKDLQRVWRARLDIGGLGIGFRLKPDAAGRLAKYTAANIGEKLAIILGNQVITAPTTRDVISEEGIISGRFTEEELDQIIIQLKLAISKSK
jgi:preprotein translocase subunit SecD